MYKEQLCFDTLIRLWEEDPAQFETFRSSAINSFFNFIGETANRHRLEQLQFRIDGIIRRHSTMRAVAWLQQLLLDEVVALQDCFHHVRAPKRYGVDDAIPYNIINFPQPGS